MQFATSFVRIRQKSVRILYLAAIAVLLGSVFPATAQLAPLRLLEPVEIGKERAASLPRHASGAVALHRSRYVRVDGAALPSVGGGPADALQLDLFEDLSIIADRLRSHWSADGETFVWTGRIRGSQRGDVIIARTGDLVSVNIHTDDHKFYWIRQVEGELHVAEEVEARMEQIRDDSVLPPDEEGSIPHLLARDKDHGERAAEGDTRIDLLVAYTVRARNAAGGTSAIQNRIQLAVAEATQSMVNSAVPIEFRLVGTMEVNYDEQSSSDPPEERLDLALSRLRGTSEGYMDEVHSMRNSTGADLVSLWLNIIGSSGGTVGLGYQMLNVSGGFASYGFSVTEQYWAPAPGLTFSHEVGHNMGAAHNRGNTGTGGAYNYSYGHQHIGSSPFRTIMAYQCAGQSCPHVNYWSNPLVNYLGVPTGIASTSANSADNAKTLTNTRTTIADFRDEGSQSCTYAVTSNTTSFSASGGTGTASVSTQSGCTWTAGAGQSWITITSGSSGTGSGTIGFTVASHSGASSRNTSVSAGGQSVTITQSGASSQINVTVTTNPVGRSITVDGTTYTSPRTFQWTPGSGHSISTTSTQTSGGTRWVFQNWSDSGALTHAVSPSTATTYTANFSTQYQLTTSASPANAGSVTRTPSSGDGFYAASTPVSVQASANSGWQFGNWTGAAGGSTNPTTVVVSSPVSVTANFTATSGSFTVATSPSGLRVQVDGVEYTAPRTFQWTQGSTHSVTALSTQGSGGTRYSFSSWSDSQPITHTVTAPADNMTLTAYHATSYLLTRNAVPSSGGSITATPASGDGYYTAGTTVSLQAVAAGGQQFVAWSGGGLSGSSNPVPVQMTAPLTVNANFSQPLVTVTIQTVPSGRSVQVDGVTVTAPASFPWSAGTMHTISAVSPQGASGGTRWAFTGWSDNGAQTHAVIAATGTITATFAAQYQLSLNASGGSVAASPQSADGYYAAGTPVQLTATPLAGNQFTGWSGDLTGPVNPGSVQVTAPRTVTAVFSPLSNPCQITLNHTAAAVAGSGDLRSVAVSTNSSCPWNAISNAAWISVESGISGSGTGTVRYRATANQSTAARSGTLSIGGVLYTVTQAAQNCSFTLSGVSSILHSGAGTYTLSIATAAGCQWTASTESGWLQFPGLRSGTGSGSVTFSVPANGGSAPRAAGVIVGGQSLQLLQAGGSAGQGFTDVSTIHPFHLYIEALRLNAITDGCTNFPGGYCPEGAMTRSEMAAFIVRTLFGESFTYSPTPYFTDVPTTHPKFSYIQKLRELGVTNGCNATQYCPSDSVTRGQMAAFLVRAALGVTAADSFPYPGGGHFNDVTPGNIFFPYIQKLKELGITSGCTATDYCSDQVNTRGQMAVFVVRGLF